MASVGGAGGRISSQGRASKLSQLVKTATEKQGQRPASNVSRLTDTPLRRGLRSRETNSTALGQRQQGEEEQATFYSAEEDSENDEDEL